MVLVAVERLLVILHPSRIYVFVAQQLVVTGPLLGDSSFLDFSILPPGVPLLGDLDEYRIDNVTALRKKTPASQRLVKQREQLIKHSRLADIFTEAPQLVFRLSLCVAQSLLY